MMLSDEQKKIGVISASLGNHAGALCYHGYKLGIPVTVVMPVIAPIMKIVACRQYGANVIVDGLDMEEARRIALRRAKEKGLMYINGHVFYSLLRATEFGAKKERKITGCFFESILIFDYSIDILSIYQVTFFKNKL